MNPRSSSMIKIAGILLSAAVAAACSGGDEKNPPKPPSSNSTSSTGTAGVAPGRPRGTRVTAGFRAL